MPFFNSSISIPFVSLQTSPRASRLSSNSSPKLFSTTSFKTFSLRQISHHKPALSPQFLIESKIGLITKPPELCIEGTGGTYFLKNHQNLPVAVFKPSNEEPLCLQNPKRTTSPNDFHFTGFIPGEGAQREIFAYQMDNQFAGVPQTHLAEVSHWIFTDNTGKLGSPRLENLKTKRGSIQQFIPDIQCSVDDIGYGKFSVADVQRIAILDMLLVNCDRNGGNILVRKRTNQLVPIDHAFCLPDYCCLTDLQWFEWITWKQVKQMPLPEVISFINDFDIADATRKAMELGIRKECILTLNLSYMFLKHALKTNLTLCNIAKLMCTRGDTPSAFANLVVGSQNKPNIAKHFAKQLPNFFNSL